jgi:hypothetical protein
MWSRSVAKASAAVPHEAAAQRAAWRRLVRNVDDPIISNADLETILRITKVPARRHRIARSSLLITIITARCSVASITAAHRERRRPRSRSETLSMQAVARRARALRDAIDRLAVQWAGCDDSRDSFWQWAACDDYEDDFDLSDLQSRLVTLAETCDRQSSQPLKKQAHRPPGTLQYPVLQYMLTNLRKAIETQGRGELTLWRDAAGKWKGTVPQVFAILRAGLPHVVTANPPYATLRRVLSITASNGDGRDDGPPMLPRFKKP